MHGTDGTLEMSPTGANFQASFYHATDGGGQ